MASFTWGRCQRGFSLLHISLIHGGGHVWRTRRVWKRHGPLGAVGEVVLTVREHEDLNVACLLRTGMARVISVYTARASALYCTTTTTTYTPFMSRRIVTEVLGTYSDGQSRGNGQVGVIDGLRTPVYSFIARDGGYVYDQPPPSPRDTSEAINGSHIKSTPRLWSVASGLRARASSPCLLVKHVAHRASPPSAHLLVIDMTGRNK